VDLREAGWECVQWIHLAQDGDRRWALVNTVMNLRLLQKAGNVFAEGLLASQGLCFMELVEDECNRHIVTGIK
jgi:hypothetical protein